MRGKGKRTLLRNNSRIHQEKIYFNFPERLESHSRPFVNQSPRKIVYAAEKFFVLCVKKFSIFSLTLPLGLWNIITKQKSWVRPKTFFFLSLEKAVFCIFHSGSAWNPSRHFCCCSRVNWEQHKFMCIDWNNSVPKNLHSTAKPYDYGLFTKFCSFLHVSRTSQHLAN